LDPERIIVRKGMRGDVPALTRIYNEQVINSAATFDLRPHTLSQRLKWFEGHGRNYPLVVVEVHGKVAGFATLSKFRDKAGYLKTVESSVYVGKEYRKQGAGTLAMKSIIRDAMRLRYHTMVAGIVPPNEASARLHRKLGFRLVGRFAEVGQKFGRWQDVDFYQLLLDHGASPGKQN
jgi:L-amino acid N-acyltransferase